MLPYDSVADIYNISLSKINDIQDLYLFNKLNIFERSNWNNSDIVPVREAKWSTKGKYNTNMKFFGYDNVQRAINQDKIPKLVKINSKSGISNNDIIIYTWEEGTSQQKAEMRKKGDYSYKKRGLFKKVYKNNEPLTLSFSIGDVLITDFVYKQINAWGESYKLDGAYFGAKEYYSSQRSSEINNNFLETTEMSDNQILEYFDNKIVDIMYDNFNEPEIIQNLNISEIYSKLGNKTKSENIVIKGVYQQQGVDYAKSINGIFSLRVNDYSKHFGNPFSSIPTEIAKGLIPTNSTKESVEKYIDWVINAKEERAQWIREQLKSGKLKGKPIVYYKELGEPSHATALDYLINKYDWSNKENKSSIYNNQIPNCI